MTEFSGLTLEELESVYTEHHTNRSTLLQLYAELLDRKQRRERSGKPEKTRAIELRLKVSSQIERQPSLEAVASGPNEGSKTSVWDQPARPTASTNARPLDSRPLGFNPTDEQLQAAKGFRTGDNLKISAFAGSGKTSTLVMLAQQARGSGVYTAFNRACVRDAAVRFGGNVKCKTIHALAFRSLAHQFRKDKLAGKLNPHLVLSHFKVEEFHAGAIRLTEQQMASLALSTFRRFAQSRGKTVRDVPVPLYGIIAHLPKGTEEALADAVYGIADAIWKKMQDPTSRLPLGHDGYLKFWALGRPLLGTDFILLDEAQDTNDVVLDLLERQTCQIVYVGDRHQQIYEWRGAVNALDRAKAAVECQLTRSFRFGQEIASLANAALDRLGEHARIVGNERVNSRVAPVSNPDAIIARSNGTVLAAVIACLQNGDIPYVEGGTADLRRLIGGVYDLDDRGFSTVPEFFGFTSWNDVVQYSESEYGQELATFVRLVQAHSLGRLWHVLKNVAENPESASLTVSTTHKAKGREWESVRLEDDFVVPEFDESGKLRPVSREEARILYVAVTRAKRFLQVGDQVRRFLGA